MTAATSRPVRGWKTPATGRRGAWRPESAAGISTTSETTRMAQVIQTTTARASTRAWSGMPWRLRARPTCDGAGNVVWEGPADEVPQRPGDADDQDDEQHEGSEALDDVDEAGHGLRLARRWRCRCPVTVM